ncbi:MAG: hypothetical protein IT384_27920 [Deltaproteobacteria bacterium]|nr:hypothetical protein [Deltaproteobacteria bacterium]
MTRVQAATGLLLLFGLGYTGLERAALLLPRSQAEAGAITAARYGAARADLTFGRLLDQARGLTRAAAAELTEADTQRAASGDTGAAERALAMLADRAGGNATAAIVKPDGRKVIAAGGSLEIEPRSRAVRDARTAAWALLERWGQNTVLVAAAPLFDGGQRASVLVLAIPLDRTMMRAWTLDERVETWAGLASRDGELWASTLDGAPAKIDPETTEIQAHEQRYVVHARSLEDDGGLAGQIIGFARVDLKPIAEVAGRLRVIFGIIGGSALVLVLVILTLGRRRTEDEEDEERDGGLEPLPPRASGVPVRAGGSASLVDDLLEGAQLGIGAVSSIPPERPPPTLSDSPRGPLRSLPPAPVGRGAAPQAASPMPLAFGPPPAAGLDRPSDLGMLLGLGPSTSPAPPPDPFPPPAPPPSRVPAAMGPGPAIPGGLTVGRGMSPPPPGHSAIRTPRPETFGYDVTPPPQLEPAPGSSSMSGVPSMLSTRPAAAPTPGELASYRAFDEDHYRVVYDEFIGSKQRLGESVDNISYDGFTAKLRKSEQALIDKHGCRTVRFQVVVRDRQVSLRPQLVR